MKYDHIKKRVEELEKKMDPEKTTIHIIRKVLHPGGESEIVHERDVIVQRQN